jgi:hypothetical protein
LTEFWIPTDLPPYLQDFNPPDFAFWRVFQATPRANLDALRLSIAAEWDRLAAEKN